MIFFFFDETSKKRRRTGIKTFDPYCYDHAL